MKRLLILSATLGISLAAFAHERPVQPTALPAKAQQFIKEHFASQQISHATYDNELTDQNYDVYLADGTHLEFTRRGAIQKVDSPRGGSIPSGLLPANIEEYVAGHHPGRRIVEAERDRHNREVKLSGDIELVLDRHGRLKWYD